MNLVQIRNLTVVDLDERRIDYVGWAKLFFCQVDNASLCDNPLVIGPSHVLSSASSASEGFALKFRIKMPICMDKKKNRSTENAERSLVIKSH